MDKPLPDIPQPVLSTKQIQTNATWADLTIDGRNHLRRFILHALGEAQDVISLDDRELWAIGLEGALTSLGERLFRGGWLPGLRRMRRIQAAGLELAKAKDKETAESTDATPKRDVSRQGQSSHDSGYFSLARDGGRHTDSEVVDPQKALASLRASVEKSATPVPKLTAKHLLLTVSSVQPTNGSETQCVFTPGVFVLPNDEENSPSLGQILYGMDTWEQLSEDHPSVQIVGGTFSFSGVTEAQQLALVKVLRLSVFTYLSIILEQALLCDSLVALRWPKPIVAGGAQNGWAGGPITRALSTGNVSSKASTKKDTGIWAFFSKKKDDLLSRTAPSLVRRGSLDLPLAQKHGRSRSPLPAPRTSQDDTAGSPSSAHRPRRFSFISDYRPPFMHPSSPDQNRAEDDTKDQVVEHPISLALAALEKARGLLSTSPNLLFFPPSLLVKLAAREKAESHAKLCGDEKAALNSLLGWDSRQLRTGAAGSGMVDTAGFVRQQSFSVLYSEYIMPRTSRPSTPNTSASTLAPTDTERHHLVLCGKRRRWVTFKFYSQADECLGEALLRMCARADDVCDNPDCRAKRTDHELRLTHAGTRITVHINGGSSPMVHNDEELPEMWASCRICEAETRKVRMQDATYLLSFSKYLELLIYSPSLCEMTPALCEHTTPPSRPWDAANTPLPKSRLNIVRHFSYSGRVIALSLSIVEDVYEVRVPRLQIVRSRPEKVEDLDRNTDNPASPDRIVAEVDRRILRREIMQFWHTVSEHMDTLEGNFVSEHSHDSYHKTLPRLPSADEAYVSFDEDGLATPKGQPSMLPPLPPNTPKTPQSHSNQAYPFPRNQEGTEDTAASTFASESSSASENTSLQLLTSMRHTFQRTEQELYAELSRTPIMNLNTVRRSFVSAGRGAVKRLSAWETKHASGPPTVPDAVAQNEPEWWKTGCHAVPGGNIIVRENDWGSIIAFTLSSLDYHRELANMSMNRTSVVPPVPPPSPTVARPSFFVKNASSRWFGSSAPSPDPDQEGVVWHEPESYSAVISRKEHPRDTASLLKLGISEVLRQKSLAEPGGSSTPSKFTGSSGSGGITMGAPPAAWAKPEVQLSKQAADGHLSLASKEGIDKVLQELEAVAETPKSVRSSWSDHTQLLGSGFVETNIRRGMAESIISASSDATTVGEHSVNLSSHSHQSEPPLPPPKDSSGVEQNSEHDASMSSKHSTEPSLPSTDSEQPSMASAFTSTLSSALRYMTRSSSPPPVSVKHHHGLLFASSPAIDDRPHIKYDWTIGKRLKFSCTVYYAKQFDALRRRCGIEDVFLQSLARSENWIAEGGKSRSNFWKTTDNQFIIKTLVNAWNVADLHVLIELGPSYFRHMDATANKPTVLAKMLGFYTVEIKNLETGSTQAKADLLVMENLFYNQTVVKTFDLKGIQGRKVKAASSGAGSKTLFDGDWIEDQQRALTLVHAHSKVVLQEAIKADSDFLARSNIMDYSLLVGIDSERKQIACGLVDTIGSYTFAKTLEYKAKQNLSGKEVTVIPPHEYQERFVTAMDNYFVACPDKWSRPLDDAKISSDYRSLPSVL